VTCSNPTTTVHVLLQMRSRHSEVDVASDDDSSEPAVDMDDVLRYRELYWRCWHADRQLRPTAAQLVDILTDWSTAV